LPPRHREIRLDAVVADTLANAHYSDTRSLDIKDLNYNERASEERIVHASRNANEASHLLEQAKENFYTLER